MNSELQYIDLYRECRELLTAHCSEVLNAPREEAFRHFGSLGFPSRKVEHYRYTDLQEAFAPDYGLNLKRLDIPVDPYEVFRCDVPNMSTSPCFIVNDAFYTRNAVQERLPEGVEVCSLNEAARLHPERVARYYTRMADCGKDALTALNTMLAQDGLWVYIPRNVIVERPLQVINILHSRVDLMVNRRVLIVLEEGAQAKILFCDHAMDDVNFLTTQVVEVFAGAGSLLDMYELEETHVRNKRFSNLYVKQEADSRVMLNSLTLHNGLTRNMTYVALDGKRAETVLLGGVVADKHQHVDNYTLIDHRVPECTSRELYKYVLDDEAIGAFAGRILVRPDAQKTSSQETNANLCVTKTARMYTQPMLEIYADDVKCNHGATVGQLDEQALFYMQQRGIPEEEARLLLKFAFVGEVIDGIAIGPLRDRLHYLVEKRFRGELNKCEGCRLCK